MDSLDRKTERDGGNSVEAVKALRESERRLRIIFDNVIAGITIHQPDGKIIGVNRRCLEMFGYAEEELIGQTPDFLKTPEFAEALLPESELLTKRAVAQGYGRGERLLKRKDGRVFWGDVSVSVLTDEKDGAVTGYFALISDISDYKRIEDELRRLNEELEARVRERTVNLQETNTALKVLLDLRQDEKSALEENVINNIRNLVIPYLDRLKGSRLTGLQATYVEMLETNLETVTSAFAKTLQSARVGLTPMEIRVADLIRAGKSSKEIANLTNLAENTIATHRKNIRTKLGIANQSVNLRSYLQSLS